MPPRPLYRWKSFWLGLFAIASVAWAWHDSLTYVRGAAWSGGHGSFAVFASSVNEVINIGKDNANLRTPGFDAWSFIPSEKSPPPSWPTVTTDPRFAAVQLQLPYWFIVTLSTMPWIAYLTIRWRRMKRLAPQERMLIDPL